MKTFIIAALTADGFIAKQAVHPTDWTSPEDKQHFRTLTKQAGVVIMGANTYKTVNQAMPERRTIVYTHDPDTVTAEDVETTHQAPAELIAGLQQDGHEQVAIIGGSSIYRHFLEAKVVDELYLTIEPMLWGTGLSLLDKAFTGQLELLELTNLNSSSILLHYRVLAA
jgi:dihydrofolate reductase